MFQHFSHISVSTTNSTKFGLLAEFPTRLLMDISYELFQIFLLSLFSKFPIGYVYGTSIVGSPICLNHPLSLRKTFFEWEDFETRMDSSLNQLFKSFSKRIFQTKSILIGVCPFVQRNNSDHWIFKNFHPIV